MWLIATLLQLCYMLYYVPVVLVVVAVLLFAVLFLLPVYGALCCFFWLCAVPCVPCFVAVLGLIARGPVAHCGLVRLGLVLPCSVELPVVLCALCCDFPCPSCAVMWFAVPVCLRCVALCLATLPFWRWVVPGVVGCFGVFGGGSGVAVLLPLWLVFVFVHFFKNLCEKEK